MKKILVIVFLLVFLSGCSSKVKVYNEKNYQSYVDNYYEFLLGNKSGMVAVDLRIYEGTESEASYLSGHIKGFINYNFKNGSTEEFITFMKMNYSTSYEVFLLGDENTNLGDLIKALKTAGYKKIHVYEDGYSSLISLSKDSLEIVIGEDDCGC